MELSGQMRLVACDLRQVGLIGEHGCADGRGTIDVESGPGGGGLLVLGLHGGADGGPELGRPAAGALTGAGDDGGELLIGEAAAALPGAFESKQAVDGHVEASCGDGEGAAPEGGSSG